MSKTTTIARIRTDGRVTKVLPNGREKPFRPTRMRTMTQGQVRNAAAADRDSRPMTADELRKADRVPRVKTLRRALGLTQEQFATRYHIPVGTLRDWEQGRSEPDQPAKAYLHVIARDPDHVYRLLSPEHD
jgi:putative transcriptional regulator